MYGMTELSTQFYDDGNAVLPSVKSGPHWIRSRLVEPITGRTWPLVSAAFWCIAIWPTTTR
jgi:hypothetical protein